MPSGKRYIVTREGIKYDLSPGQFELLAKKSFKVRKLDQFNWTYQQRINGLCNKWLFRQIKGTYERTKLGTEIYKILSARP